MCWWCCMRLLEKCLPRNDIIRELAPYLQHAHEEENCRASEAISRDESESFHPSAPREHHSDTRDPNAYDSWQTQRAEPLLSSKRRNETFVSAPRGIQSIHRARTPTTACNRVKYTRQNSLILAETVQNVVSQCSEPIEYSTFVFKGPIKSQISSDVYSSNEVIAQPTSQSGTTHGEASPSARKTYKIKSDLGDLTPVAWEKVVLVQVSAENFRQLVENHSSELLEEAIILYEHTVLSRLSSEYGGVEILRQRRLGIYIVAFTSEFLAAKWCISLQLSIVYAAWNVKLLKQITLLDEYYQKMPGKSRKSVLLYRGFRVRMVIHTVNNVELPNTLVNAVTYTHTISEFSHGGQIILSDNVWDRLKEQLVQLGNPVVEDLGVHVVLGQNVELMLLLPRNLELRRFRPLKSPQQISLGMRDAPSAMNEVTMVFTFIEGARPLVRSHAEELANRIKTLSSIARELLAKHKGYECQELQGDFMLAFFHPCSAVLWCGEFQLHIQAKFREWNAIHRRDRKELEFSMSMGIETGKPASVSPHKTSGRADYFGNIVNQTARIAKAAHGGQILIGGDAWKTFSQTYSRISTNVTTHDVISDTSQATIFEFKFHGYYPFKGIAAPIALIEATPVDPRHVQRVVERKVNGDDCLVSVFRPPKAKVLEDCMIQNEHRIDVNNIPMEMWKVHYTKRNENNTIRETEFDESYSIREDVLLSEVYEPMDSSEMSMSGIETLAMSGGFRFHGWAEELYAGKQSKNVYSQVMERI